MNVAAARRLDRVGWLAFAAVAAAASALLLWLGRGATFSLDELDWLMESPGLGIGDAFAPHNGHLVATSRLLYEAVFEAFGPDYVAFRLLTVAAAVLTAALFFAYASRRIGKPAALAPALVLLLFGSDYAHLLTGNGFTVLLSIACGIGALLALERGDRAGDGAACALLCLGVLTYTFALPFIVGVAILVGLRPDRWRRLWIVAVPMLAYAVWWFYPHDLAGDPQDQATAINILLLPSWGFQSLSAVLGAVSGLDFDFSGAGDSVLRAGPVLAVLAIAAVAWRIARGSLPAAFWAVLGVLVGLWVLGALVAGPVRQPDDARYMFPVLIAVLLLAAWCARGVSWTRGRLIALYAVAAVGVSANLIELRDGGETLRDSLAPPTLIQLGGLEIAGARADPDADLDLAAEAVGFTLPYSIPAAPDQTPIASYAAVVERYGGFGYDAAELRGRDDGERALLDSVLVSSLGISLAPASAADTTAGCRSLGAEAELAPGDRIALEAVDGPAEVGLRRFGETALALGTVQPGRPAVLGLPVDGAPDPWLVSASAPTRVCSVR